MLIQDGIAAVVYGGEEVQQRTVGRLIPWRLARSAAPPRVDPVVRVFAGDRPLAGADVQVELPDGTRRSAKTGERGAAALDVRPGHLPLAVRVAREGFAAHREPAWIPDERALHVRLTGTGRS